MVSHSMFTFATTEHSPFVYTSVRNMPEEEPSTDSILSSSSSSSTLSASPVLQSMISHSESSTSSNTSDFHSSSFDNCSTSPPPSFKRQDSSSSSSSSHPPTPRSKCSPQLGGHRHSTAFTNNISTTTTKSDSLGLSAFRPASEVIADLPNEERRICNNSSPCPIQRSNTYSSSDSGCCVHGDRLFSISEPNANDDETFWGQTTMASNAIIGHSSTRQATTTVSRQHTLSPPANGCRRCGSASSLSSSLSSSSFTTNLSSSLPNSAPPTQSTTLVSPFSLSFFAASSTVSGGQSSIQTQTSSSSTPTPPPLPSVKVDSNHPQEIANSRYQSLENSLNQTFSIGLPTTLKPGYTARSRHNSTSGCTGAPCGATVINGIINGSFAAATGEPAAIHLQPGDLVEIDRTLYAHWALYVGEGQVVHIVDEHSNQDLPVGSWGLVKRDALTSVAGSSFVRANNKEVPAKERMLLARPSVEVVQQALAMVGKLVPYNTLTRNSEHYITEWKYGRAWSDQAKVAMSAMKMLRRDYLAGHAFYVNSLQQVLNTPGVFSTSGSSSPPTLLRSYSLASSTGSSQTEPVA